MPLDGRFDRREQLDVAGCFFDKNGRYRAPIKHFKLLNV